MRSNEEIDHKIEELQKIRARAQEEYATLVQQHGADRTREMKEIHLFLQLMEVQINTLLWVTGRIEAIDG